jgi:hypothetical protein
MSGPNNNALVRRLLLLCVALPAGFALLWWAQKPLPAAPSQGVKLTNAPVLGALGGSNGGGAASTHAPLSSVLSDAFRLRPFAVVREQGAYQWTAEDGRDPAVIRQLAHNPLEAERMLEENSRIFARQLVYHQGGFSLLAQAARMGNSMSELTIPGLDGQAYEVELAKNEFEAGGDRGAIAGRLKNRPDSMVTIAFQGGREAFTLVSTEDHLFLVAEPRESGELIVKRVDPEKYGIGTKGDCVVVMPEKK